MSPKIIIQVTLLLVAILTVTGSVYAQAPISRIGHSGKVNRVSFSPDGKVLASASDDGTTRLWDVASGKELFVLRSKPSAGEIVPSEVVTVRSVLFSPDGKVLATADDNGVHLWDPLKGIWTATFDSSYSITSLAFSPDGKFLAGGQDPLPFKIPLPAGITLPPDHVTLWNVARREEEKTFDNAYAPVAFNSTGTILATSAEDPAIQLWNLKTGDISKTIKIPEKEGRPGFLSFNAAGDTIIETGGGDITSSNAINQWRVATGRSVPTPLKTTGLCLVTEDRRAMLIQDADSENGGLSIVNLLTGQPTRLVVGDTDISEPGAFSKDGKLLAVTGKNGTEIKLIDVSKKSVSRKISGYTSETTSMAFSADGKYIVAAYADSQLIWWNTQTGKPEKTVIAISADDPGSSSVSGALLSPDARYFLSALSTLYDAATGREVAKGFSATDSSIFSGDGQRFVVQTDETFTVREVPSGKVIKKFLHEIDPAAEKSITATNFDGSVIACVVGKDLIVWNAANGAVNRKIPDVVGEYPVLAKLAVSPNGKFVVLKDSSLLKVLDIEKGRAVFETKSYGYAFAVSPDNRVIAVYDHSSIQLLDASTGATILKSDVGDMGGDAPGISFNKNGSLIAAFGLRGIRLVDGKTAKLLFEMK